MDRNQDSGGKKAKKPKIFVLDTNIIHSRKGMTT